MAIRQVDERFLVGTIIPTMIEAEELADSLDAIDNMRSRSKEYLESAHAKNITTTLDELCLRVKYEGTLGGWRSIEARLPEIRKRCPHTHKVGRKIWTKDDEGNSTLSEPVPTCKRCHEQWLEGLADKA